jgi:hypothetical protein
MAKLEEAVLALVSEGLSSVARILGIQQGKDRVEAGLMKYGIVVEVEKRTLDGCCHRL